MRSVLMTILIFQFILFGLAIPVMILVSGAGGATAAVLGGGGMVLALVSAVLLRKPVGFILGWLSQVVGVALGVVTPAMYAVGGLFALLWVITFVLGKRLDAGNPLAGAR
jgi:hypothetical protein